MIACAQKGDTGGVYNLASGKETSILELANLINEFTGNTTPLDMLPARDWDRSGKRFASTYKAKKELGFTTKIEMREGIKRTVEWTKTNKELIKLSIAKHDKMMSQEKA